MTAEVCTHDELHDDVCMAVVQRNGVWRCYRCGRRFVFVPTAEHEALRAAYIDLREEVENLREQLTATLSANYKLRTAKRTPSDAR